jgi:tRNA threonylcarbamoyladenosine biosynthesis protein TsaB
MLLLVTDTSGKHGSVALARAGERAKPNEVDIVEEVPLVGGTFSAQLVPQIAALLARHGFSKTDIGGFIVASGPGSFTGLRVGLAAIKALAEILHKPIVPVSLLEVVAVASRVSGKVLAALDAGRGEVYMGEYEVREGSTRLLGEQLLPKDEFSLAAKGLFVATPDETLARIAGNGCASVVLVPFPEAESIVRLGRRKLQAGETVTPEQLEANYIRRSDAEVLAGKSW